MFPRRGNEMERRRTFDRYPLVIRAMKFVALLTNGEATACIEAIKRGDEWSSEAVDHFGGTRAVLEAAWRRRHVVRIVSIPRRSKCVVYH